MNYDFNAPVNRRNTSSYKWDSDDNPEMLPMWVADMDFRTAPAIVERLRRRVDGGVFGYTRVPGEYYDAAISWFYNRHSLKLDRDDIIYTSGVVPAISAIIKALTKPGDGVIVQTPVYNCFFSSIRNNKCRIIENPLLYTPLSECEFTYKMDFEGLEQLCAEPSNTMLLLCNPHNPGGRVWTPDELSHLAQICRRHGVTVVSDEIHCELVLPPNGSYTPYLSVDKSADGKAVMCFSPSKAFNTAGLQIANIACRDSNTRRLIDRAINDNEVCDVNPFGVDSLIAAYNASGDWLDRLRQYLADNFSLTLDFFNSNFKQLPVSRLEATYLPWIDVRQLHMPSVEIEERLKQENVWINAGTMYGTDGFIRLNIATRRDLLTEGLHRIASGLNKIITNS